MLRRAACLTAILLTACAAEAPELIVSAAQDTLSVNPTLAQVGPARPGPVDEARAFFFAQTDLYLAGASPAADGPLADVLRAMGRDDLVAAEGNDAADIACPQHWVDPLEMIAQHAQDARIVIIENQRSAPAQVAFVQAMVSRLVVDGFTAYADDGLTLGAGAASDPAIPLITEGFVTRDSGHGRLLRAVKSSGLNLVDAGIWWNGAGELASLSPDEQTLRRQRALAEQVSRRIFWSTPGARAIIHIESSGDPEGTRAFREDVARLTGFEPLVLGLTSCSETNEQPAFLPSLGDGAGSVAKANLVFAIPRETMKDGRMSPGRASNEAPVDVPTTFLPADEPVLIEARRLNDPDLAVPEDRLMLLPGDRLPLMLPPGDYRIEAWSRDGRLAAPVDVNVT